MSNEIQNTTIFPAGALPPTTAAPEGPRGGGGDDTHVAPSAAPAGSGQQSTGVNSGKLPKLAQAIPTGAIQP